MNTLCLATLFFLSVVSQVLVAAPVVFFGEDLNNSPNSRLSFTPNLDSAKSSFLSSLSGVLSTGFEDFEKLSPGDIPTSGIDLAFDNGSNAKVTGIDAEVTDLPSGVTPSSGGLSGKRYPTSGSKFLSVNTTAGDLIVDFVNPVTAFGFSGTDIGDSGDLFLTLRHTDSSEELLNVPHTIYSGSGNPNPDANALFYGFIFYDGTTIDRVNFGNSLDSVDAIGLDDLVVSTVVPIPVSFLLFGSVVAGMSVFYVKKRKLA